MSAVVTGLERLLRDGPSSVGNPRIGLITNHTGVTGTLDHATDALFRAGFRLAALFAPEHGIRGEAQAGDPVASTIDPETDLPLHSLYGERVQPTADMLAGLDALVYDIQDVGARFYTYTSTLVHCLVAAAARGMPFIVLDRPAPITGDAVEGPILEPGLRSFVGATEVPIRYGMTAGELARFARRALDLDVDLRVVPLEGWSRRMWYDETGLPWVSPSPNIPTLDTATVYPGTCFFEGATVSEGRGTTKPFELIGAPRADGRRVAARLNALGLPGCRFRPVSFLPSFGKHAGAACCGVQIHVLDRRALQPVRAGVAMLAAFHDEYPAQFAWCDPERSPRFIDRLAGTARLREAVEQGRTGAFIESWGAETERYLPLRDGALLYE